MKPLGRALAVSAAVLALAACGTQTSDPQSADEPTPSPSTSPTPSETVEPTPSATPSTSEASVPATPGDLTLVGVPDGAPPHIPYLDTGRDGWLLIEPDGTTRPLDRQYDAFATMGDGIVGTAAVDDTTRAFVLDGDLHEVSSAEVRGGTIATTPDGEIVAWLGADRRPHVVEQGGAQEYDLNPVPQGDHVAAVVSDGTTCKEGEEGQGCAVFVNSIDATAAWISVSHGIVDSVPGVLEIDDAAASGVLGMTSLLDAGSCWGPFKGSKSAPVWETCDYTLFDYSPSGARILGGPAYLDGFGQGLAAVLDGADGRVVAEWHSKGQTALLDTIWEDEDHVLAVVYQREQWAVLRLGVTDGSVEVAVPPVHDPTGDAPFVLPTV
ncbi:MAG: hypothetical protein ABIO16_05185 [Nocardioides sp.]